VLYAVINNRQHILRLLLRQPDLRFGQDNASLITAVARGNYRILAMLLEDERSGALFTRGGQQSLVTAASRDQWRVVELLLRDGRIDPWLDEGDALTRAVFHRCYRSLALLLRDPRVERRLLGMGWASVRDYWRHFTSTRWRDTVYAGHQPYLA
jgi:hypothetical protein